MKLKRSKKIILTFMMIAVMLFVFSNTTVFGAINTSYTGVDTVPDTALEEAFEDSSLLGLLARLIYAVGRFLEWILGTIFKLLSGTSDFPWADKIVFNAVPLLDVNFINPADGSFVNNEEIKAVLKNTYSTILSLAVSFFGIVVLITAIKLVISTIASEKAKYKQAIIDWTIGFVMLFCMHYFISFVFYLNEQLVAVASKIVTTELAKAEINSIKIAEVQAEALADELISDVKSKGLTDIARTLENNKGLLTVYMNLTSADKAKGLHEFLMKQKTWYSFGADVRRNEEEQYRALGAIISWAASENITVKRLKEIKDNMYIYEATSTASTGDSFTSYAQALSKEQMDEIFSGMTTYVDSGTKVKGKVASGGGRIVKSVTSGGKTYYITKGAEQFGASYQDSNPDGSDRYYWTKVLDDMITLKGASSTSGGTASAKGTRLIADLAAYFRFNSYNKELRSTNVTGVKNGDNIQIQNMIMYAILVAQSLILFISYIKRLFYVVLLAMLAPLVVVVDFFQKFGK